MAAYYTSASDRDLCRRLEGATTMLHILSATFTDTDAELPRRLSNAREGRILRSLTAIANLLVRTQEVVGVAVKSSGDGILLVARNVCATASDAWVEHEESIRCAANSSPVLLCLD